MKSAAYRSCCVLVVFLNLTGGSLLAQVNPVLFTYNNFAPPVSNLQVNGDATLTGGVLRLTPAASGQSGSAWYYGGNTDGPVPVPLITGFTTTFQFRISGSEAPADGFAFVIQKGTFAANPDIPCPQQNQTSGIFAWEQRDAGCGGDIGYAGLTNSLAVEFDDFQNAWDLDANHVAIQSCGAGANSSNHQGACFVARTTPANPLNAVIADGKAHTVVIRYSPPNCGGESCLNPNNLQIFVDGLLSLSATYDLANLGLDLNLDAFVGFVGRTGELNANQDIVSWSFSTNLPPSPPITNANPVVTAIFNNAPGNLVEEVVDFRQAFANNTLTIVDGTQMEVSNQAIPVAAWQPTWAQGTPFATSTCWPHTGEGSNCKLYIDLCTNNNSGIPAGANCPTSSVANILVTDSFDGPKIDPASLPPNTGFGFLEATDTWQGGPCTFTVPSSAVGEPCPVNQLSALTGDPNLVGTVPHFNSGFIAIYGVPQPGTSVALNPAPNGNGWINSNNVSATFTTSTQPPPTPNPNNYVQPYVADVTYQLSTSSGTPVASAVLPAPAKTYSFVSPVQNLGSLPDGQYRLSYGGTDDHGTHELLYSLVSNLYSTSNKTLNVNIDTTKPTETVSVGNSSPYLNAADSVTVSCSDALSGVVSCGSQAYNPPVPSTGPVVMALDTSTPGPHSLAIAATDAAGNTSSTVVHYNVVYRFFGFVPELPYPQINPAKAGTVIPAGFLLLDGNYQPVTNLTSIAVSGFASQGCSGVNPTTPVAITGRLVNLGYGIYVYLWQTQKSLAGECVTFQADLGDGVNHELNFLFKCGHKGDRSGLSTTRDADVLPPPSFRFHDDEHCLDINHD